MDAKQKTNGWERFLDGQASQNKMPNKNLHWDSGGHECSDEGAFFDRVFAEFLQDPVLNIRVFSVSLQSFLQLIRELIQI